MRNMIIHISYFSSYRRNLTGILPLLRSVSPFNQLAAPNYVLPPSLVVKLKREIFQLARSMLVAISFPLQMRSSQVARDFNPVTLTVVWVAFFPHGNTEPSPPKQLVHSMQKGPTGIDVHDIVAELCVIADTLMSCGASGGSVKRMISGAKSSHTDFESPGKYTFKSSFWG